MNYQLVHHIPGRIRVRYARHSINNKQAALVQTLLTIQEGILSAVVNTISGSILIEYDGISEKQVLAFLKALTGKYLNDPTLLASVSTPVTSDSLLWNLVSMVGKHFIKKLLPMPVRRIFMLFNMGPRLLKGVGSILHGRMFSVDVLDATALSLSYTTGDFNTAGSISLMLNMSDELEDFTKRKSFDSLTQTLLVTNEKIQVIKDDEEVSVSVNSIVVDDIIVCRMGSVIPVDGIVIKGVADVDQSSMTGESLPVHKEKDSYVFASTVVTDGEIYIKVKTAGNQTRVSKIADMVNNSQNLKAQSQIKAELIADKIVFFNFFVAGLTYLVTRNFVKASSTLLVDYSCAIKLSAPICTLAAMKECAQAGILVKGGKYLEDLATADTFVFDKTGTLTESVPKVTKIIPMKGYNETEVLKLSACLEEHFPHSLGRAVVQSAIDNGINHKEEHSKVDYIVAHGIASTLNNQKLRIGSAHFIFDDEKVEYTEEVKEAELKMADSGCSVLYFAIENKLAGLIGIEDPIRSETYETLALLRKLNVKNIVMLTGDGETTAKVISAKAGTDIYKSQLLPDQKVKYIKQLKKQGHKVVMVGDGINDSPALASADIGIAMGKASSVASATADILLPDTGLKSLPVLRQIGLKLLDRMNTNTQSIISLNTTFIGLSLGGAITPATAALLHNSSTVAISAASMRPYLPQE